MEEHLSPTETARRLGTTVKALKVYERLGLVRPLRTGAGWRLYGPTQIPRLHEVLALKGLGLTLAQIGAVLAGRPTELDRTLAVQETALWERRREIDRALARVRQIRTRLAAGDALSTAELISVARETTATTGHWGERIADYYRRHLGESGLARLTPGDPQEWAGLISELKALCAAQTASERARLPGISAPVDRRFPFARFGRRSAAQPPSLRRLGRGSRRPVQRRRPADRQGRVRLPRPAGDLITRPACRPRREAQGATTSA